MSGDVHSLAGCGLGYRPLQPHPEQPLAVRVALPSQVRATPEEETELFGLTVGREGLEQHQDQLVPPFVQDLMAGQLQLEHTPAAIHKCGRQYHHHL